MDVGCSVRSGLGLRNAVHSVHFPDGRPSRSKPETKPLAVTHDLHGRSSDLRNARYTSARRETVTLGEWVMPLVRIDLRQGKTPEYRLKIGDMVYRAMRETINVPEHDRFQVITDHPRGRAGL